MVAQLDKEYVELSKERALKRFLSYLFFEGRPHTTKGQWFNPVVSVSYTHLTLPTKRVV